MSQENMELVKRSFELFLGVVLRPGSRRSTPMSARTSPHIHCRTSGAGSRTRAFPTDMMATS